MEQFPSVTHEPPPTGREQFSVGSALGKGFSIWFQNLPAFLVMTGIAFLPLLVFGLLYDPYKAGSLDELQGKFLVFSIVLGLGSILLQKVATAAVTYGVVEQMSGRHASIGHCLAVGLRRMLPTVVVAIVAWLAIGFGLMLLIIPGIIVYCILYVVIPVSVIEQNGIGGAFSRSAFLTKGYRWQILGLSILLLLIGGLFGYTAQSLFVDTVDGMVVPSDWKLYVVVSIAVQMIAGALSATVVAVSYALLRNEKDGVGVGELARVFD